MPFNLAVALTPKDNVAIWAGIFLPRVTCNVVLLLLHLSPVAKTTQQGQPSLCTSLGCLVINVAAIVLWANWRLPGQLVGLSYKLEQLSKLVLATSAVSSGLALLEVLHLNMVCSELCAGMIVLSLLWELAHVHVLPAQLKYSHTSNMTLSFYILGLVLADFLFICFLAHIFTRGVLIPWQNVYYKLI